VLAHLIVPHTEVRLRRADGRALIRSMDADTLDTVAKTLAGPVAEPGANAELAAVDLDFRAADYEKGVAASVDDIRAGRLQKV
ncbi:hypothetical protein ACSNOK_35670, partial [Streptomyces sp. URMC 126]